VSENKESSQEWKALYLFFCM